MRKAPSNIPTAPSALTPAFVNFLEASSFPCVGAKSALASGTLSILEARDIRSAWDDLVIQEKLARFGESLGGPRLKSFAILFHGPTDLTEAAFEQALWERLQSVRDKDHWLSYPHDVRVAPDPASPDFAFSVGGQAYFVVGMHPGASRQSRRTPMPAMVFNPFSQFEALRSEGKYNRMSDVVRRRDEVLCGSPNPMLDHHGQSSAARQFSGRTVNDTWTCPLRQPN